MVKQIHIFLDIANAIQCEKETDYYAVEILSSCLASTVQFITCKIDVLILGRCLHMLNFMHLHD